jgi:hypothetical protein
LLNTLRLTKASTLARSPSSMVIATFVWLMAATLLGMTKHHTSGLVQWQGEAVNSLIKKPTAF